MLTWLHLGLLSIACSGLVFLLIPVFFGLRHGYKRLLSLLRRR